MGAPSSSTGYSGTPLSKKLGLKEGMRVSLVDAPPELLDWLAPLPAGLQFCSKPDAEVALVHTFVTARSELTRQLTRWRKSLSDEVVLWVSWPKRAAKLPTDITEDVIREVALPLGWVDVKVCAVSEVWSGLKLVVRKELRTGSGGGRAAGLPRVRR